jgi:hypothetical protein
MAPQIVITRCVCACYMDANHSHTKSGSTSRSMLDFEAFDIRAPMHSWCYRVQFSQCI